MLNYVGQQRMNSIDKKNYKNVSYIVIVIGGWGGSLHNRSQVEEGRFTGTPLKRTQSVALFVTRLAT